MRKLELDDEELEATRKKKCKYCENGIKKEKTEFYFSLPIMDDFTKKYIDVYENGSPVQYIRKYKNKYQLTTELVNDDGDVLTVDIAYCPMCGRKLV